MSKIVSDMKTQIGLRSDIPHFLKSHSLHNRLCEVGTRFGYNLQQLAAAEPYLLIAVDHYQNTGVKAEQDTGLSQKELNKIYDDVFTRFLNDPAIRIYRGRSEDACKLFPPKFFDYVYVDADHSYEGALRDIRLWWGRVRQGGILAGHDYINTASQNGVDFGVIKAVEQFMLDTKIKPENLHYTKEGYRTWLLFKEEGE